MKTYLSETGVSLVDEFGNFVKRNRKTLPNYIERDGFFFVSIVFRYHLTFYYISDLNI